MRYSNWPTRLRLLSKPGVLTMIVALGTGSFAQAQRIVTPDNSLGSQVATQIASLEAEKEARTPAQQKIDSQLIYAAKMDSGEAITEAVPSLEVNVGEDKNGLVEVDIDGAVTPSLLKYIALLGGHVENSFPEFNALRAKLPLGQVETLASSGDVRFIKPAVLMDLRTSLSQRPHRALRPLLPLAARPSRLRALLAQAEANKLPRVNAALALNEFAGLSLLMPTTNLLTHAFTLDAFGPGSTTNTGAVTGEGDATHRAAQARTTFGATGAAIRVGVLSDSIDDANGSYAAAVASGDVSPVTVIPGQAGTGEGEGLAMLEIIHDLAPDAQLFFATANGGPPQFASNIIALRNQGCDVIIDDVGYYNESPFQDDVISQAVTLVTATGAAYFSSAANSGSVKKGTAGTWEGNFVDGGAAAAPISTTAKGGYRLNLFPAGTDQTTGAAILARTYDSFPASTPTAGGARYSSLFWDDPLGASTNDYDLFYLNNTGTTIRASSTNVQSGTQDPYEAINIDAVATSFTNSRLVIAKAATAAPRFLHLDTGRGFLTLVTNGNTRGHATVPAAYGVAATPAAAPFNEGRGTTAATGPYPLGFSTANQVEAFSSDGPRHVFYNPDGTPITADLSATGGTVRFKPDITAADGVVTTLPAGGGLNPFYGTSAAAPHAGAIAALLRSFNISLTPAQIRTILTGPAAIDIEGAGYDVNSGYGIVDAVNALTATTANPAELVTLTLSASSVSGGTVVMGTVVLKDPAPVGGTVVALSTTGPVSGVPATITVPAGQNTVSFPITTAVVTTSTSATITASYQGLFRPATLSIVALYSISGKVTTTTGVAVSGVAINTMVPGTITLPSMTNTPTPPAALADGADQTGANPGAPVTLPITFTGPGTVGSIKVGVNINHTYRGDLLLALFGPDGSYVILKNPSGDATHDYITSFPDLTTPDEPLSGLFGEPVAGTWMLYVQDYYSGDTGMVNSFTLTLGQNALVSATATTDMLGNYTFASLAPGSYTLTPSKLGFGFSSASATVTVGPNALQNFILSQPGIRTSATAVKTGTEYLVTVTVANGGPDAANVQITRALIGAASPPLPAVLGTITLGSSASVTLHYPLSIGSSGSTVALRLSGTAAGTSFGGTIPVVLP